MVSEGICAASEHKTCKHGSGETLQEHGDHVDGCFDSSDMATVREIFFNEEEDWPWHQGIRLC